MTIDDYGNGKILIFVSTDVKSIGQAYKLIGLGFNSFTFCLLVITEGKLKSISFYFMWEVSSRECDIVLTKQVQWSFWSNC
jgi:hypothetical protein